MPKLLEQGRDLNAFKEAVSRTSGKGVTVLELDIPDRTVIRFLPDIDNGALVRAALPGLDASISAIPGMHLSAPSSYSVRDGVGTVQIRVYTNPLPFIPIVTAAVVVGVLGAFGVLSWRIYKAGAGELFFIILALGLVAIGVFWAYRRA